MKTYKGFDKDLKCRGFQYEVGKEYEEQGEIKACSHGFHACEAPLDVLAYYPPATSRYCEVEQSGELSRDNEDTKVASSKIKIGAEIGIPGLVKAHVEWVKEHTKKENEEANTGDYSASTNTGDYSASTNTGDYSASTNTGNYSESSVSGKESFAIAIGFDSKAKGSIGCFIVLADWREINGELHIVDVKAAIVDGENIKPDTWYKCVDGKFEVCDEQ